LFFNLNTEIPSSEGKALLNRLRTYVMDLTLAAEDFVAKVERGEARSVRSYSKFTKALSLLAG